jgi:Tfp pilus assembly protein PilN
MIEINLLPEELKKKKKKVELPNVSFLPVITVLIGIIIMVHLLLVLSINLKTRSLKRLEKKWQEIAPENKRADKLKHEIGGMRARIQAIDNLIKGRINWAKKLSDLSDAMIPGIWLNRLWLEKKLMLSESESESGRGVREQDGEGQESIVLKTLHLNGSVIATGGEETAAIGRFIRSLKDSKGFFADFKDIESVSIQRTRLEDIEVMEFELLCYFK